ncbi:MAG: 2-C-methyl-D-erythritol 4-phosphate cytidylyltransferase [Betaproteobacteria bacterium]|nr:2-C-methyl-D-erythritol 4-phosphate cytidylyltransferase [Betaproteobacteria bacterium]
MGAAAPKQYLPLAGRPMLYHSIKCMAVPPVETVFVVLAPDDTTFAEFDWSEFAGRLEPLYCGGATRRDSVHNGLIAAMSAVDADDWVLVHDAARPCLPRADLERLIETLKDDEVGGLLALPAADTVKRATSDARVTATEDRSQLWLAQTPQMFRAGLLAQALHTAHGEVTDEASAVEQMGLKPRLVAGSRLNLKVTYPEDVLIAEGILGRLT